MESVRAQTYSKWELASVAACSTDRTVECSNEYQAKDSRIHLLELEENSGPGVARNKAMEHAKGRYIAFLDSDDQWFPEKLEKQLRFMQDKDIAFSFTKYVRMREDGTLTNAVTE